MDLAAVRRFALGLPEVAEEPHFDKSSFRVAGKIFATVPPGGDHVHVMVDEADARAAAADQPEAVELLWWGQRLSGVRVALGSQGVSDDLLCELLDAAWRRKAPKRLLG